ncbi:MAG: hypothetical protein DRJ51_01430 [Thermoprotei archaeon]|nr:MAG: hypothetical protein DRJ51_01430 [Thermoprotei archaeon]
MRPLVKEVIIENFMSYRYARIPLKAGLNIITGPNGAGKSSILLAISVALGQTYTERGRKLSDLIRRGEDIARVTVVVDNSPRHGTKPLPRWRYDEFYLTRYIRADGRYWHELNHNPATKNEVSRLLRKIGLNPDNMFIIMHQNMIEEFVYLSPQERLSLIEDATGLKGYRDAILRALRRLEYTLSEEEKVKKLLNEAEKKLAQVKAEYDLYIEKTKLEERKRYLQLERAWTIVRDWERKVRMLEDELEKLSVEKEKLTKLISKCKRDFETYLDMISNYEKQILDSYSKGLETHEFKKLLRDYRRIWELYAENLCNMKLSEFKLTLILNKIQEKSSELEESRGALNEFLKRALILGERIKTERTLKEIEEELHQVELQLAAYRHVREDIREIYERYLQDLNRLKERALIAARNREKALEELEYRRNLWKKKVIELISGIRELYLKYLSFVDAVGDVRIVNLDDVEKAGVEVLVGFRGASPTVLDPYTQSGGERTTATMCFLLALQQYIRSPFKAIDEFDVHMDPRNREAIFNLIFSIVEENPVSQYLIITPGTLTENIQKANVIVVQNVKGVSKVGVFR